MPDVENHVRFCVKAFGERNRELCYMVNSWMDAPSRGLGSAHRKTRHDIDFTPVEACRVYGDCVDQGERWIKLPRTAKNRLIASTVLQHLKLDGLITLEQERAWTWKQASINIEERIRKAELLRKREERKSAGFWVGLVLGFLAGFAYTAASTAPHYYLGWWMNALLFGIFIGGVGGIIGGFIASAIE